MVFLMAELDLDSFRLSEEQVALMVRHKKKIRRRKAKRNGWIFTCYVQGEWIEKAAHLRGRCLHTALALVHRAKLHKSSCVVLRKETLRRFGLSVATTRRHLDLLENAGLINVTHQKGRRPRVVLVGCFVRPKKG